MDTGRLRDLPFSSDQGGVSELAFSHNGEILASVNTAGTIQLWDVATGTSRGRPLSSHRRGKVHSLAFSPDGKTLVSGCEDGSIIVWDIGSGPPLSERLSLDLERSTRALSPDGSRLASSSCRKSEYPGCTKSEIRLWNINTGQSLGGPLTGPGGSVVSLTFSPDGHSLASGGCAKREGSDCTQGEIRLWNIDTGQSLGGPLTGATDRVVGLAFSPDGRTLASGSCGKREGSDCAQGEIRLWEVGTGQSLGEPLPIPMLRAVSLAFSPDGGTLASGSCSKREGAGCAEAEIRLWDLHNRPLRGAAFPSHQNFLNGLAFSPDGKTLASAGNDVILWDVQTRQQRGEPLKGLSAVRYLAFSPDRMTLAAAGDNISADREDVLVMWDLSTRRTLGLPLDHQGVSSLAFGSDGKSLISVGEDAALKWDLDAASWGARACRIANRNLTIEEWQRYFPDDSYRKTCEGLAIDPGLLREALDLARAGRPEDALARFHHAQKMDPNPDPAAEARFAALGLVERAKELARTGDLEQAVAAFRQAKEQNPGLTLDPETEARRFAFPAFLHAGRELARQGKDGEAIAAFRRAANLNLNPSITAAALNEACWTGSLAGRADAVMKSCEEGVSLKPEDGAIRDSRGLARALTGNPQGAIEDFKFFIEWAKKNQGSDPDERKREVQKRERWIADLGKGRNPLDAATLEALRKE